MAEGEFPKTDGDVLYASEINIFSPIGTISPWLKSYTNTPALTGAWVECNGQVLSDADSVYNGQTIPDINGYTGTQRFLRGGGSSDGSTPTASGDTGGSDTMAHTHNTNAASNPNNASDGSRNYAAIGVVTAASNTENRPPFYEVVWIIRVK